MQGNLVVIMLTFMMETVGLMLILVAIKTYVYIGNWDSEYYAELMNALAPLGFIGMAMDALSGYGITVDPLPGFDNVLVYFPFFIFGLALAIFFISSRYSRENLAYPGVASLAAGLTIIGVFITGAYDYASQDFAFIGLFFLLQGASAIIVFLIVVLISGPEKFLFRVSARARPGRELLNRKRLRPLTVRLFLYSLAGIQSVVVASSMFYILTSILGT